MEKRKNRQEFLENLINRYEGFSQSVQYIMSSKTDYNGIIDTLANLVDCEDRYRPALESYLSGVADYIVVKEDETATTILSHLQQSDKGRITVVPMSLVSNAVSNNGNLPSSNGRIQAFQQLLNFPADYQPLFQYLFNQVYLVENLSEAIEYRKQFPGVTFVTLEGEVIGQFGQITGGSRSRQVNLVGRKERLNSIRQEIETISGELSGNRQQQEEIESKLVKALQKKGEFENLLATAKQELITLEKSMASVFLLNWKSLKKRSEDLLTEREQLDNRIAQAAIEIEKLQPEIAELDARIAAFRESETTQKEALDVAEKNMRETVTLTQKRQIEYLNLVSREKEQQQQQEFLSQSSQDTEKFIEERQNRIEQHEEILDKLKQELATGENQLVELYSLRDAQEQQKNALEKQYQEMRGNINTRENELKKRQRLLLQARDRLQELEIPHQGI